MTARARLLRHSFNSMAATGRGCVKTREAICVGEMLLILRSKIQKHPTYARQIDSG